MYVRTYVHAQMNSHTEIMADKEVGGFIKINRTYCILECKHLYDAFRTITQLIESYKSETCWLDVPLRKCVRTYLIKFIYVVIYVYCTGVEPEIFACGN